VRRRNIFETLAIAAWRRVYIVNIAVAWYTAVCCFLSTTSRSPIGCVIAVSRAGGVTVTVGRRYWERTGRTDDPESRSTNGFGNLKIDLVEDAERCDGVTNVVPSGGQKWYVRRRYVVREI
jgi:hypothetical protein